MEDIDKIITLAQLSMVKEYIDNNDNKFLDGNGLITSEKGIANLRVWGGILQYKKSDGNWYDVAYDSSGSGNPSP